MTVYIKNTKTGIIEIEKNAVKVVTLADGRIRAISEGNGSWMTVSTVYKDCFIARVEA